MLDLGINLEPLILLIIANRIKPNNYLPGKHYVVIGG